MRGTLTMTRVGDHVVTAGTVVRGIATGLERSLRALLLEPEQQPIRSPRPIISFPTC